MAPRNAFLLSPRTHFLCSSSAFRFRFVIFFNIFVETNTNRRNRREKFEKLFIIIIVITHSLHSQYAKVIWIWNEHECINVNVAAAPEEFIWNFVHNNSVWLLYALCRAE